MIRADAFGSVRSNSANAENSVRIVSHAVGLSFTAVYMVFPRRAMFTPIHSGLLRECQKAPPPDEGDGAIIMPKRGGEWLRGSESNRLHGRYERPDLPMSYPAPKYYARIWMMSSGRHCGKCAKHQRRRKQIDFAISTMICSGPRPLLNVPAPRVFFRNEPFTVEVFRVGWRRVVVG